MENNVKNQFDDDQTIMDPEMARVPEPETSRNDNNVKDSEDTQEKKSSRSSNVIYGVAGGVVGAAAGFAGSQVFGGTEEEPEIAVEPEAPHSHASELAPDATAGTFMGNDIHIAHVDDGMSFSQAFAAAREQVGPGGVFEWHGGVYGTYYSNEWNAMSDEQHDQWFHSVEYQAVREEAAGYEDDANDRHDVADNDAVADEENHQGETLHNASEQDIVSVDVHVTADDIQGGYEVVAIEEVDVDGVTVDVAEVDVDGEQVFLVDVDDDAIVDPAIHDENHDGNFTENEAIDVSDANIAMPANCQVEVIDDPDVQLEDLGVEVIGVDTDVNIADHTVNVATIQIEDEIGFVIDINQTNTADIIVPDMNDNMVLDEEDIVVAAENDVLLDVSDAGIGMPVDDCMANEPLAMNDYMNDANVDDFMA